MRFGRFFFRKFSNTSHEPKKSTRFPLRPLLFGGVAATALYVAHSVSKTQSQEHDERRKGIASEWEVRILKAIPLRFTSFIWGKLTHLHLPVWARGPVYKTYSNMFGCNLDEMSADLESYQSLAAFFARKLKQGVRSMSDGLVSPVDGRVLHFGEVKGDQLEQIKGISYSMSKFLGSSENPLHNGGDLSQKSNKLYQCVIYLAPGDYHGIHSPINWTIHERKHFPGYLFPVAPWFVSFVQGLFALNERVALTGTWEHGFFSLSPVGATNVGSIAINFDPDVKTNEFPRPRVEFIEKKYEKPVSVKKGEEIAFFHLGSTVVLIFQSPLFEFTVERGQKIQIGEKLGKIIKT